MKKIFVKFFNYSLLALIAFAFSANAQTKSSSPAAATLPIIVGSKSIDHQWEYLVVSYGKTVFGIPEKTLAYRSIGLSATAQEANEIQQSLDILGRFGWEIITIVGSIGGDQQIVMKRKYDKNRVATEGLEIIRGREIYLKDLVDILERGRRIQEDSRAAAVAEKNQPRLIELDAKEKDDKRNALVSERDSLLKRKLNEIAWWIETKASLTSKYDNGSDLDFEIEIDLTEKMLRGGNSYRASEVIEWLKKTGAPSLQQAADSFKPFGGVDIEVKAVIVFNGRKVKVGSIKTRFSSYSKRWDTY